MVSQWNLLQMLLLRWKTSMEYRYMTTRGPAHALWCLWNIGWWNTTCQCQFLPHAKNQKDFTKKLGTSWKWKTLPVFQSLSMQAMISQPQASLVIPTQKYFAKLVLEVFEQPRRPLFSLLFLFCLFLLWQDDVASQNLQLWCSVTCICNDVASQVAHAKLLTKIFVSCVTSWVQGVSTISKKIGEERGARPLSNCKLNHQCFEPEIAWIKLFDYSSTMFIAFVHASFSQNWTSRPEEIWCGILPKLYFHYKGVTINTQKI